MLIHYIVLFSVSKWRHIIKLSSSESAMNRHMRRWRQGPSGDKCCTQQHLLKSRVSEDLHALTAPSALPHLSHRSEREGSDCFSFHPAIVLQEVLMLRLHFWHPMAQFEQAAVAMRVWLTPHRYLLRAHLECWTGMCALGVRRKYTLFLWVLLLIIKTLVAEKNISLLCSSL